MIQILQRIIIIHWKVFCIVQTQTENVIRGANFGVRILLCELRKLLYFSMLSHLFQGLQLPVSKGVGRLNWVNACHIFICSMLCVLNYWHKISCWILKETHFSGDHKHLLSTLLTSYVPLSFKTIMLTFASLFNSLNSYLWLLPVSGFQMSVTQ